MNGDVSTGTAFNDSLLVELSKSSPVLSNRALYRRLRQLSGQIRFLALLLSDTLAFLIAFLIADVSNTIVFRNSAVSALSLFQSYPNGAGGHLAEAGFMFVIFCTHLGSRGHYTQRIPLWTEVSEVINSAFLTFLCNAVLLMSLSGGPLSAELIVRWVCMVPLVLVGRRLTRLAMRSVGLSTLRTVVVGDEASIQRLSGALKAEASLDYDVVGEVNPDAMRGHDTPAALHALLSSYGADFLALASPLQDRDEANLVAVLDQARIPFAVMPTTQLLPVLYGRPHYFFSHNVTLLSRQHAVAEPISRALKVAFDFLIAGILVLLIAPLLVVMAVAIRLDGGPAIFRHNRLGASNRTFGCMKFRTMRVDGDAILAKVLATDPIAAAEWAAIRKLRHDPRVTPVGKFLRKTSLDELPQLFNVLRGEMSLVGPRPIVRSETAFYGDDMYYYYQARPGLTGLWQVSGRNNTSYERRVELDVWYVKNWTFWHDILILLKTIPAVLLRRGAH